MAIPDFQKLMLPLLELAGDGKEHSLRDARDHLARRLGLTEEEQKALLPSGQLVFPNRVGWANTHLTKAEVLERPRRGFFRITDRGKEILREKPQELKRSLHHDWDVFF